METADIHKFLEFLFQIYLADESIGKGDDYILLLLLEWITNIYYNATLHCLDRCFLAFKPAHNISWVLI